jgi:glycine/D-amino acid oxidase-like deaminating enzyme
VSQVRQRRCVVIGAGVLGASVAARLASTGMHVTLLDQDQPGHATSRWSFAWLNSNDKGPRPYHELNHAGIRAWADLASDLEGPAWYRPVGNIELATSDPERAELIARVRRLTGWDYPARLIDAAEVSQLEPSLRPAARHTTAAWFPGEGYLLTEPLIARLVALATSRGAVLLTGEPGRVVGFGTSTTRVRTATGDVLEADEVVCCAGRWVPELAALVGAASAVPAADTASVVPAADTASVVPAADTASVVPAGDAAPVPLEGWAEPGATAPGFVVRAGPVAGAGPQRVVHAPEIYLRPHSDGLVHLEAPDAAVDLHTPEPELRRWAGELLSRARRTVRGLDDARVVAYQVCVRPMPVDGQSIVGRLPGAEWLYVAVTHSGVTLAAHLSRLIAAELTTGAPATNAPATNAPATNAPATNAFAAELAPYRPGRFQRSPYT